MLFLHPALAQGMDKCGTVSYISTATQWPAPTNSEMGITSSKEKICMCSHKEPRFIVSFEGLKREREREREGGLGGGAFSGGRTIWNASGGRK